MQALEISAATEQQQEYALAATAFAGAEELRGRWDEPSQRAAIEKYREASRRWESVNERTKAAGALNSIGDVHYILSEYAQALDYYEKSLALSESVGDQHGRIAALNNIGYVYIYLGDNPKARRYATRVLDYIEGMGTTDRSVEYKGAEARALNSLGEIYYSLSDLQKSLEFFERALVLWSSVGDRRGEALAHLNLGYSFNDLGDLQKAASHYELSLGLWQATNDLRGVALAQTALGGIHSFLGEKQKALDLHKQAVSFFRAMRNYQGEAASLNGIAQVYEDLNEYEAALDNYEQALRVNERIGNRDFASLGKYCVGRILYQTGEIDRALDNYRQSLELSREVGDRAIEAHVLKGIGMIYNAKGEKQKALEQFRLVLRLYSRLGNRRGHAYTLSNIGYIYAEAGEKQKALEYHRRALPLMRAAQDRRGEALALFNIARAERDRGNLNQALSLVKESIEIIETMRTKVTNEELRTSYFASVHQHYELYIDLLMRLDGQHPEGGFAAAALLASEKARARSLLESLSEERAELHHGARSALLDQERELQQKLDARAEYKMRLVSDGKQAEAQAVEIDREIRALTIEYQEVRSRIREQIPRYAALTQPDLLQVEDIQREVEADDTLLLEFALGDERSYLWALSADGLKSYELPDRLTIENAARKVYELLTARQSISDQPPSRREELIREADAAYWQQAAALSQMLLGPVAGQLNARRLLIVSDGFLQNIPFEALPAPAVMNPQGAPPIRASLRADQPEPLFFNHEIVGLPSALILLALRYEKGQPAPPAKMIAVLADPVFDKDDPRVIARSIGDESAAKHENDAYLHRALRGMDGQTDSLNIPRLPSTHREAEAIMAVTPRAQGMMATGFEASRERVLDADLGQYRILHFATHGVLDSEHPELSGIILSLVDEHGNSQKGFLRLHDIYNLDLHTDLIVLSTCRSGLGRDIRGEGLVSLTRGFMYAGSKSVVASLWKVDDEATAELMNHFYSALLKDGLSPAAALRAAKMEMWKQERWRTPFFWAAFVLQGEYNQHFNAVKDESQNSHFIFIAVSILLATGLCVFWLFRKRYERG
ncbi:MAG TPA: CHAT domain-containing protein [Pyrinomonadaceae bacterium]|nr:CHAT domain-containing protein [Pyrinomonadaceae bacterium]